MTAPAGLRVVVIGTSLGGLPIAAALPLRGRWDATGAKQDPDTAISLGCTSGVLAKCVRWGYRPVMLAGAAVSRAMDAAQGGQGGQA